MATPQEVQDALEAMSREEHGDLSTQVGGGSATVEGQLIRFLTHPELDNVYSWALGLTSEADKRTQAFVDSAKATKRIVRAAWISALTACVAAAAAVISALVAYTALQMPCN